MGSLAGHALPGSFFLLHGLIWAILSMWMQLTSKVSKKNKKEATTKSSFFEYRREHRLARKSWIPLPCCPRIPVEPIIKVVLPFIGILVEAFLDYFHGKLGFFVYHITQSGGRLNDMAKFHHIIMYGSFLVSGIVDIISLVVKLPRQASQIFFSLAFWVEWMLFYSHSDSNNSLNVSFHFLLNLTILLCVIITALRIFYFSHFLINVGVAFSIMLQGTWFIQVGMSLYPPNGTNALKISDPHRATMYVYAIFTVHVLLLALSFLVLWGVLACCARAITSRRLLNKSFHVNNSQDLLHSEENKRLITVEDVKRTDLSVNIEMDEVQVAETVS